MLTVAVMLSGPHRRAMAETALESVPLDSPLVSELLIRHQAGAWDWAPDLRRKWERHPKVRVIEFPDRVGYADSYNRTLDAVHTPWAMLLPDDDFLIRPAARAALEAAFAQPDLDRYGLVTFGWYYLKNKLFLHGHLKANDLPALIRQTPKLSSVLFNLNKVRALNGFARDAGAVIDTALIGSLMYRFDALISNAPVGVYRMHEGQISAGALLRQDVESLRARLGEFAKSEPEREEFDALLDGFITPSMSRMRTLLASASFGLRARTRPVPTRRSIRFRTWLPPR